MPALPWSTERNLENSLIEFLQTQLASYTVLDLDGNTKPISVRVGFMPNDTWQLPVVSAYTDSRTTPRLSIGSNAREKNYLLILDIRAFDTGMQQDLVDIVMNKINDGFPFFEYTPNIVAPDNPTKVQTGYASIEFVSNVPVRFGDNVDMMEKFRQNITISAFIEVQI
jgi:hypothetical protein